MGRIGRGWQLTKKSWSVVRADGSLLGFAVIAAVSGVLCAAVFFGAGAGLVLATTADWLAVPVALVGLYVLVTIGIFCNVALACCATRALDGERTTVGQGLAAAGSRLGLILKWAAVQLVVGTVISLIQSALRQGAGQVMGLIVGGLANFAWMVATFFVVPGIAFEGLGPKQALKRSTELIWARWGEGLTGTTAIGLVAFLVGFLPGALLIGIGIGMAQQSAGAGAVTISIGVLLMALTMLLQTTITTVFKVALFRFATQGAVLGPFDRAELEHAFSSAPGGLRNPPGRKRS
ncbi:DUF6159 family protein [Nakamurella multipartita]|uniref:Glycerophosphoryl diester phosphodiesterase membrane domain-containing protein n=1 Tax=Nakamurella multipartita (strain ATCC 700099 / DSM 44233 / CIP 104796 / JCM 9543 / NBRC 105858 / Y-104) TaxID=479431 RepID=C8X7J6_NAKMY|nr:DUF6159 family protein [Nakamurella multipartita]ACV78949.1 hypothetical protein Namu_2597 [Nakamurella multipartita DSM 44233]